MKLGNLERMKSAANVTRILSFGGGVQSSAMLLMVLNGELPRPDAVIFADPRWESAHTYAWIEQCEALCVGAGLPFYRVSAGNLREMSLDASQSRGDKNQRFASMPLHVRNEKNEHAMLQRQCTTEFKIVPIYRKVRALMGVQPRHRVPASHHCEMRIGISTDEAQRMSEPKKIKWATHYYPLIERRLSRADCLNWIARAGYDKPPKSACLGCPFQDNGRWREMKTERPDEFADAVEFDEAIREGLRGGKHQAFLHRSLIPLSEVDFRNAEDMGQLQFDGMVNECEGMCGL